jgi:hypothetical protein
MFHHPIQCNILLLFANLAKRAIIFKGNEWATGISQCLQRQQQHQQNGRWKVACVRKISANSFTTHHKDQ